MKTLPFLFGLLFWGSLAAQTQSELFLRPGVIGRFFKPRLFWSNCGEKDPRVGISRPSGQASRK